MSECKNAENELNKVDQLMDEIDHSMSKDKKIDREKLKSSTSLIIDGIGVLVDGVRGVSKEIKKKMDNK